jgi:hypothetical protein
MKNIKFNYLYRDGANYKSWGDVVFSNPDGLTLSEIESKLIDAFLPDKLFIAHQISIPEKFLFLSGKFTKFDHCYHELDSVEICQDIPTDGLGRSIKEFMKEVELSSQRGWEAFDISDRFDIFIKQTHKQAKEAGLKPADITSAIAKARVRK